MRQTALNGCTSGPDKNNPTDHLTVENRLDCPQEGAHAPLLLRTLGRTGLYLLGASGQAQREVFRHSRAIDEQRGKSLLVDLVDSDARQRLECVGFPDACEQSRLAEEIARRQ